MNYVQQYADRLVANTPITIIANLLLWSPSLAVVFRQFWLSHKPVPYPEGTRRLFSSKVCEYTNAIGSQELMEQNANFDYSKFVLEEGYLKVEASCLAQQLRRTRSKK